MGFIHTLERIHDGVFNTIEQAAGPWFLPLLARLVFSSVLLMFFISSGLTKVGSGFPDFLIPTAGAYAQILPSITEAVSYDTDQIALFPWKLIVLGGTYAEFALPVMLLLGVFTRLTSVGLIGFIIVMSFVDIQFHGLEPASIGAMFDRIHNSIIFDQRLLWIFPLIYLAIRGGGPISVDALVLRRFSCQAK